MRLALLSLLTLFACTSDVSIGKTRVDDDSDGYAANVDCDDAHATVNPDAPELCDGLDNDCDGEIDEEAGAGTWYTDADGDSYGDAASAVSACEAPAGAVTQAGDCDDAQAAAWPGNGELCDGIDNDCDGVVDDDPSDLGTFYDDGDGDGHGDPDTATQACAPDAGQVTEGDDCDDEAADIHPGADEGDCADPVDYNCDGSVGYADADADGVPACEDCDDADAGRSPERVEVCDEADTDEDCDGLADDDDSAPSGERDGYPDGDGDGYGDAAGVLSACDLPSGYVDNDEDCDDGDAAVNPGELEICDAADTDEDCDGLADDDDASVSGEAAWYRDGDRDGYGDASRTLSACEQPSGYVGDDQDCDDADSTVNPGETEVCDAADTDEDCDGLADDDDASVSGESAWYRDGDRDGFGDASRASSACDVPSGYVDDDQDCDDGDATVNPDGEEVCGDGLDQDCSGDDETCPVTGDYSGTYSLDSCYDAKIYGTSASDMFGLVMVGGDFDGDGAGDLVAGSPYASGGTVDGTLYGYYGPITAGASSAEAIDDFQYYTNTSVSSTFFAGLANLGDVSGDGADDLAALKSSGTWLLFEGGDAGALKYSSADDATLSCSLVARAGSALGGEGAWLCSDTAASSAAGQVKVMDGVTSTASATITGVAANDSLGSSMGGGQDVDGDGVGDLVLGAPYVDDGGASAGAVYVVLGPPSGSTSAADAEAIVVGDANADYLGAMVLLAGDLDGDGYADPMASAPESDLNGTGSGAAYLFTALDSGAASDVARTVITGEDAGDVLTETGLDMADVSGDGHQDVMVGTMYNDDAAADAGCAWLFYDLPSGTVSAGSADAEFRGPKNADYAGIVALLPDTDGDGAAEIAVGGYGHDYGSGSSSATNRGAIWIWPGM